MALYPTLTESQQDQTFRLRVIKEHDDYLAGEAECRRLLAKKHQRAATAIDGTSLRVIGGLDVAGIVLIFTGIGAIPGAILFGLGMAVGVFKHSRIIQCGLDKRASIHKLVSEALRDGTISPEEFDKIAGEVERYNLMKRYIQNKLRSDEADLKNALLLVYEQLRQKLEKISRTITRRVSVSLALCTCAWTCSCAGAPPSCSDNQESPPPPYTAAIPTACATFVFHVSENSCLD